MIMTDTLKRSAEDLTLDYSISRSTHRKHARRPDYHGMTVVTWMAMATSTSSELACALVLYLGL